MRTARVISSCLAAILALGQLPAAGQQAPAPSSVPKPAGAQRKVIINGKTLTEAQIKSLETAVHGPVTSGDYWYDKVSGAWGWTGGPLAGIIPAGLDAGGKLRADASNGNSGVFINGRELAALDVVRLQQWIGTPVIPGRYWVDAQGYFGYEGGPVAGNLILLARQNGTRYGSQGNTRTECNGNACSSSNSNTGIGVITDGQGGGAVFSDGKVITPP